MPPSPSMRPPGAEPPVRVRGDACPGALRLHSAADGHLARVRIPAGDLTVRQASALADAADRLGDGHLSLTSRGNVELRGLPDDCGAHLAGLLRDAGLLPSERHERIRNILASPLAGLDRNTPADVRLWARELDALLCASESATALSGRFLFVLDDGRGDVAALGGDVSLVAEPGAGAASGAASALASAPASAGRTSSGAGALLRVGDDPAALRVAGPDAPRAALVAAESFLAAAGASGSGAWRVRELPDGQRPTALDVAEALRAAGIAAEYVAGGAGCAAGDAECAAGDAERAAGDAERAGGAPRPPAVYADSSAPGLVEGPDGRHALSVLAPLGRLSTAQWRLLIATAADHGSGELRLTPWRGIVIPGLSGLPALPGLRGLPGLSGPPATTAADRMAALSAAGLVTDPASPWHRLGACTGRPGCAKSLTDVRTDATTAIEAGAPLPGASLPDTSTPVTPTPSPSAPSDPAPPAPFTVPRGLPVHWSGCERRCGHPHGTWVDVLATPEGYRVSVVRPYAPASPVTRETSPARPSAPPPPGTPAPAPATQEPSVPRPYAPPVTQETRPQ
ncbi:cobalamin biosynthesis protein CobG [Streptomyces sp. NPDC048506]|uniref:cobalamin biosynthesis protein CobG n=1 Tax=Streptomyces sp. NPDC048506 TaxID=3155028 RepID=UPI00341CCA6A